MTALPKPQITNDQATETAPTAEYRLAGIAIALAAGSTFLALLDATVVNIAFADLRADFTDVPIPRLTWTITAYAVVFAALLAGAGRLADVVGRRRLFFWSVLGFAVTSLAAALAPTANWLIATRAVQGATAAGMIPAGLALLLAYTAPAKRAAAIGAWGAAGAMAAAVGPSLGGVMVDVWGWRSVFLINVPLGLLIVLGLRRLNPDTPASRQLPDPLGTLALVLAIGGPVTALSQGTVWGWTDPRVLALFAAGPIFGAIVALRLRHPAPVIDLSLWRIPGFAAANVTAALFGAAMYAWLLACPLFLPSIWHYSILTAGFGVSPGAFTAALGAVVVGRRVPVNRQWIAVVFGGVAAGIAFLLMSQTVGSEASYLVRWLPPGLLGGLGIGCVLTGLSSITSAVMPPERFAAGSGVLMTSRQVGGAIGVAGLAVILETDGPLGLNSYLNGFLWCGVIAILAGISAVALRRRS